MKRELKEITKVVLEKNTLIKYQGIPFVLLQDIIVEGSKSNYDLAISLQKETENISYLEKIESKKVSKLKVFYSAFNIPNNTWENTHPFWDNVQQALQQQKTHIMTADGNIQEIVSANSVTGGKYEIVNNI